MKFRLFFWLTVELLLISLAQAAGPTVMPAMPRLTIESESFEAVGQLSDEGLVWWIDRADSNAPVLAAQLEVEAGGKTIQAHFRSERGDYLIADREWLKPLRSPGRHPLALTLIAGEDSDLLAGELRVENTPDSLSTVTAISWKTLTLAALAGLVAWAVVRRRRGGVA